MDLNKRIYVAGSSGMVGSSLCRLLNSKGLTLDNKKLIITKRNDLDLTNYDSVDKWFKRNKPDIVIAAAAKVGGILANATQPSEYLLENLKIQNNLIEASWKNSVSKFLFLGSSCIYPKFAQQPLKEEYLLEGALESTNQWYAIAKIAGLKLCEALNNQYNFDAISLMPTNLYGPKDNYKDGESHVMASLIKKFYEAKISNKKEVNCWGSGKPMREFLYIEDFAEACYHILTTWCKDKSSKTDKNYFNIPRLINIGSDYEISISELASKIAKITDYKGTIIWDKSKPDGTPRKKLNTEKINKLGWHAKTNIDTGIFKTFESFKYELSNNSIRI
tara:strand:- start:22 stop:1020 length:999 start_codon:yes stop_codon:yes gene_type:complete